MKNIILFSLAVLVLGSSCKKKKEACVTSVATVSGTYKLTSLRSKASGGQETEIIGAYPACYIDDKYVLNANGDYLHQDAGVTCSPPGNATDDWSLTGSTFKLAGQIFTLQGFDCSTLVVYSLNATTGEKLTYTFVRQ